MIEKTPEDKESQAREQVHKKFISLADKLLENATEYMPVWKMAKYNFNPEQARKLYHEVSGSALGKYLKKHKEFAVGSSLEASIGVENYIYPDDSGHTEIYIDFDFRFPIGILNSIRTKIETRRLDVVNYVFSSERMQEVMGYDGHDWEYPKLTAKQLEKLHDIIDSNTKGDAESPTENELKP